MPRKLGEEGEVRLAGAAEDVPVDLDPADPARLGEHARLRLDELRGQDPAAGAHGRLTAEPLEVTRQLLDGVDRADTLDLDSDPLLLRVATHEVDRADVGRPLAPHQPQPLAAPLRRVG